jgi:methylated-DNA-[protein]-cysteine S-methyltransferase
VEDGILAKITIIGWGQMASTIYLSTFKTDLLGLVGVAVSQHGLLRLRMNQESPDHFFEVNTRYQEGDYIFSETAPQLVVDQILAYLDHKILKFNLTIDWTVYTDFQRAVLQETCRIPFGETRSYGDIAVAIGNPKASRAIGQAEKRNQAPLVVPCHRVIGSDGSLTGYGGSENIDLKSKILAFERDAIRKL